MRSEGSNQIPGSNQVLEKGCRSEGSNQNGLENGSVASALPRRRAARRAPTKSQHQIHNITT